MVSLSIQRDLGAQSARDGGGGDCAFELFRDAGLRLVAGGRMTPAVLGLRV